MKRNAQVRTKLRTEIDIGNCSCAQVKHRLAMASVRGILNIQSLNELTYEKGVKVTQKKEMNEKGDVAVRLSREPSCMCMRPGRSRYTCPCLEIARLMQLPGSDVPLHR